MELLVAADSIFYKTPDGKYWCKTIYGYSFWERYLTEFDRVAIVSRVRAVGFEDIEGYLRVDGPRVNIKELPYMRGMKQYILNYFKFTKSVKKAIRDSKCALIRLPSVSAAMVLKYYKRKRLPYAIEVVADPYYAYSSNKIAKILYTKHLKKVCLQANGVSYVTKEYLQNQYPCYARINKESDNYFESYYSTIDLPETYISKPRKYNKEKSSYRIVHTANSINNDIKGHGELIKIVKKLRENGQDVRVTFIGDGDKRVYFEEMAENLGISEYVEFTGLKSSADEVRKLLISSDIFVFPTKAEGLPRAVIEAMAVGLPCLSTPVNGIPELLKNEYLLDPYDIDGFVKKLMYIMNSPSLLEEMSNENIEKAREYVNSELTIRRQAFYKKLKDICK